MKKYVEKTMRIKGIKSIICNKCGKEIENTEEWNPDYDNFQSFELLFGFGSDFDGFRMMFDICDDCMVEFIKSFKIKPHEHISMFGE